MAKSVHLGLFISRLIAPMAAKHGAQSRLKSMKAKAASFPCPLEKRLKSCATFPQI